jgi:hypothetical protein
LTEAASAAPAVLVVRSDVAVTAAETEAASLICAVRAAVDVTDTAVDAASGICVVSPAVGVTDALRLDARRTAVVIAALEVADALTVDASLICVVSAADAVTDALADAASRICVVSDAELVTPVLTLESSAVLDAAALLNSSRSDMASGLDQRELLGGKVCLTPSGEVLVSPLGIPFLGRQRGKCEPKRRHRFGHHMHNNLYRAPDLHA